MTDSLRASILRLLGYRVDVVEFVDLAHSPKNLLLRAARAEAADTGGLGAPEARQSGEEPLFPPDLEALRADYEATKKSWGVVPYLEDLLIQGLTDFEDEQASGAGNAPSKYQLDYAARIRAAFPERAGALSAGLELE